MKAIAKNNFYELSYDNSNKWVFWTMKGFWQNMSVVPNFHSDWEKIIAQAEKPFKIFADLSKLKTMPDDVKAENDKMQQKLMKNGCEKVACLIDSSITKMSLNEVLNKSGMDRMVKYFTSTESIDAKEWLKS